MIFSILTGIVFFIIAMLYFYNTTFMVRLFHVLREKVFTDMSILLYGKKIGTVFLSLSIIIIYASLFDYLSVNLADSSRPGFKLMEDINIRRASDAFQESNYVKTLLITSSILESNPKNIKALMLAGSASLVLGRKEAAKAFWLKALSLEPKNITLKGGLMSLQELEKLEKNTKKSKPVKNQAKNR